MKKDLEILEKYEPWFHSAVYADYMRALWKSDFDVLVPIYEKWTGRKITNNFTCSKCKLNFIREFGKLYYKNKEEYEKQSKQKAREISHNANGGREGDIECKGKRNSNPTGQRRQPKADKGAKK